MQRRRVGQEYKMLINSLSGGLASAANAILAHEAGLPFINVFADTSEEDDDLHRFLYDIEQRLGQSIVRLKDGRDTWDVFVDEEYIGNSRVAPCSRILKTEPIMRWANLFAAPTDPIMIGFSYDEEERQARAAKNWAPRPVRSLIAEQKLSGDAVEKLVCVKYGIKKPRLYAMGFPHNNCRGKCPRAGQGQFGLLLDRSPTVYAMNEQRNEWARREIQRKAQIRIAAGTYRGKSPDGSPGGFIRVKRNGVTEYLHMKEFRERVQSGELKPARYEMGGCGCFTDDQ
jgi:hypothetical protein